ncbi:MAG TPA: class I SAM-dependent methyltransferase [Pseudonocardiaceae bacterium]
MALDDVRRDWTRLGAEDPLWAVMLLPGKQGGRWDVEEFLATGRADVEHTWAWLTRLGLPTRFGRVLDFGCGVGRLSQALAAHADEVVGVDISPTMLEQARRLDRSGGRCRFLLNDAPDLGLLAGASVDLVYSMLVLQHVPRAAVDAYLAEFLRVLRPGGLAVVQLATAPLWTAKGVAWRLLPFPVIAWAQRRLLRYPAPMRMTCVPDADVTALVARHGGAVLDRRPDPTYTEDWRATRYVIRREAD